METTASPSSRPGRDPAGPPAEAPAARPLRTIHLNTERTWRGGEQQVLYLVQGLARRGHEATILCQPGSPLETRARAAGLDVRPWRSTGEVDPVAIARLAALLRRGRYDVIHCHTSHSHGLALLARLLAGRPRPPLLVTRRVDFSIFRRSFFGLNGLKYRAADGFIAISEAVRRALARDGIPPERITVVRSGVQCDRFARTGAAGAAEGPLDPDYRTVFGLPQGAPLVGNVAHCAPHKGQHHLVEAIPIVLAKRPDARFLIVGEGERREALIARVKALGLERHAVLPGFRDDIPAILRALDVFVLPSVEEGLGTSILDAMAAGTPVIATSTGGIPEAVEDGVTGRIVRAAEPAALAAAILELLGDPPLARRLAAAAAARVRAEFDVDATVAGTIAVYRRVVTETPRTGAAAMPAGAPGGIALTPPVPAHGVPVQGARL